MDANKLKCYFVKKTLEYLDCIKYSVDCCADNLMKYYQLYKLSISDCELTYDLQCALEQSNIPNYFVDCNSGTYVEPVSCADQVNITFNFVDNSCLYEATLQNPSNPNSQAPNITLKDDEIYQVMDINLVVTNSCTSETTLIENLKGYCSNINLVANCNDVNKGNEVYIGKELWNNGSIPLLPTGYFYNFTFYETDDSGQLIDQPFNIDTLSFLQPSSTWCPTCTTIPLNSIRFNSPTFESSMAALFENISRHRYGTTDKVKIKTKVITTTSGDVLGVNLYTAVKHNPSGKWMGFRRDKAVVGISLGNTYGISDGSTVLTQVAGRFYKPPSIVYTTPCGDLELNVPQQSVFLNITNNTDFNSIVLDPIFPIKPFLNNNYNLAFGNTLSNCISYLIIATASLTNTNATITSLEWFDANNQLLIPVAQTTTSSAISISSSGDFRCKVTLSNGCIKQYLVLIPSKVIIEI